MALSNCRAGVFIFLVVLTKTVVFGAGTDLPPAVSGFPIGRCVKVLGVTAPEDAKTVGFEYVELALQDLLPLSDEEFSKTSERLHRLGLPAISGYGFLPSDLTLVGPAADLPRIDTQLHRGLARAHQLGLRFVVYGNLLTAGRTVPPGFSRDQAWSQLVEFGRHAAAEAAKQDLTVLIEPMPLDSTNLVNTVAEALALVKEIASPNFQILVDYDFLIQSKEDLAILTRAAPQIRQIEISNPNGRVYPQRVEEADYVAFFRALKKGGYHGGFSIHGKPTDFFTDAPRAIAMLRTLAAAELSDRAR